MTTTDRLEVVRRFFADGWNRGTAEAVADLIHEDYASEDSGFFRADPDAVSGLRRLSGPEAFEDHLRIYRELYDDLRFDVERMLADGDTGVITVWSPSGTTKDRTFTNRGGGETPYKLRGQGVSVTQVVDGTVSRHDMFWLRDPLFP